MKSQKKQNRRLFDDDVFTSPKPLETPEMEERKWNTADFVGKYHLSKFKNHLTPLPGSQVAIEQHHDVAKANYYKSLDDMVQEKAKKSEAKLAVKLESTEFRTKVFFDTVIGIPMKDSENILNEKEKLLQSTFVQKDDIKQINKFMTNVELNRSHYVSFAITSGFQSINYQDPKSGNTALHIAVRHGYVDTVEELLKFKCDPDAKNKLGNNAIHNCWMFWKTDPLRSKEERIEQENKTCKLLLSILSYNGFVDSQDLKGQSALHIACRLGSVQAVKTILSFKADFLLLTKEGKSCQDIALEFGNEETYKLLNSWRLIRKHIVHLDFHVVWHKFLKDYEAIINAHKTAETILSELEMEVNIKRLERDAKHGLSIEDPLLKQAYTEHRLDTVNIPKPWEPGWAAYVKHQEAAGIIDLKTKLDSLTRTIKGHKNKTKLKAPKPFGVENTLPDRPTPIARPRTLHPVMLSSTSGASASKLSTSPSLVASKSSRQLVSISNIGEEISVITGEGNEEENNEQEEQEEGEEVDVYAVNRYQAPKKKHNDEASLSALDKRRRNLAHAVALDAKFLKFTKRLTTNSALLIPLRDPQAPLNDTEEEQSIIRRIVSQGPEFEKFNKYKKNDRFAELVGIKHDLPLNSIGAYSKPVDYTIPNERDLLYECLTNKELPSETAVPKSRAGARPLSRPASTSANQQNTSADNSKRALVVDVEKKEKVDLVNGSRPRYVSAELLPSNRVVSVVERMANEKKERDAAALKKKQGLASESAVAEARARMEAEIAQNAQNILNNVDSSAGAENEYVSRSKQQASDERGVTMSNMFLKKAEVKYGAGRITSTHNCTGTIEEPWSTVGARYKTVNGDRTA